MESHADYLKRLERKKNGAFYIEEHASRAVLRVDPPGMDGHPVRKEDVLARLRLFGFEEFDSEHLAAIVEDCDGQSYDICAWTEPENRDAVVRLEISEDRMMVRLFSEPPTHRGRVLSEEIIRTVLGKEKIIYGIDESALVEILAETREQERKRKDGSIRAFHRTAVETIIAIGKLPEPGCDGRIKYHFEPRPRPRPGPSAESTDRVDFRKLDMIQTCMKDKILAEIVAGAKGSEGRDVMGEVLEAPAISDAGFRPGANVRASADGQKLYAEIDGHVRMSEDASGMIARIDVDEVLRLENVDYHIGHLDFPGTVIIEGAVLDGFRIRAAGDIIIKKTVGAVSLQAGGDVILAGGLVSRGQASVQAAGSLYARFVQNASVYVQDSVYIEEAAMHAHIAAGNNIFIEGGRGELIGGSTLCGGLLRARKIGARNETLTRLTVGMNPEVMTDLQHLEESRLEKMQTLDKVVLHIKQMEEGWRKGRAKIAEDETAYEKLMQIRDGYEAAFKNLDEQREGIYSRIKPNPDAEAEAMEVVYPGTEISFGAGIKSYHVSTRPIQAYCRFTVEDGAAVLRHSDL